MLRSPRSLLAAAAACAGGFVVLLAIAYGWPVARWADGAALDGFIELRSALDATLLDRIAHLADPAPYALAGLVFAAWALVRGRPGNALAIGVLLGTSALASQVLQAALAHPRPHSLIGAEEIAAQAFPSGHATAAMALALAAVIAAPAAWRPTAAALGALFALAVGGSIVALGWHFPSDVLGGYLLAAGVAFAVCAPLRAEASTRASRLGPVVVAAVAVGAGSAWALQRVPDAAGFAAEHTSAVLAAVVLTLGAAVLATSVAVAQRR